MRYERIFLGAMLVLSAGACGNDAASVMAQDPSGGRDQFSRPNIILIMADDLGWGDTGYSGNALAETPNIDAMAANGMVFNRFYSAAPVCSPTRGSVMTGRHPFRYGIYHANVGHLPEEEITIAELLRSEGYRTGFFGKWHLGTLTKTERDANRGGRPEFEKEYSPPWLHGFDTVFATESKTPTYDPMVKPKVGYQPTWWNVVVGSEDGEPYGTFYWDTDGKKVSENLSGDDTRIIVDRAIPFIEEASASQTPFFTVVWTHTPHLPVVASDENKTAIASDDPYTAHYYGSIRALDLQIGRIRQRLEELGLANNTLIWFTSDNGPEHAHPFAPGSTGGLRGQKRSLYEGGIRVPGIVEWRGQIPSGVEVDVPAVTSDILPTVLDYLKISFPDERIVDGVSLKPALSGVAMKRITGIGFESGHQIAYTEGDYKLYSGQNPGVDLDFELYDLINDPSESQDISDEHPHIVTGMKENLNRWRQSVATSIKEQHQRTSDDN